MSERGTIGTELQADATLGGKTLEPLQVPGVKNFAASAAMIKMRIRTIAGEQWTVARELRRRIKNRFDAEGVELPVPQLSVFMGAGSKPFAVDARWSGGGRRRGRAGRPPHAG
ncbi:MAG: mechanosensitive ion channel family protein [Pseudomonadota bacterium]|nr:mechanosensitive ion channel family protein [Pseudomonadota bacterium]